MVPSFRLARYLCMHAYVFCGISSFATASLATIEFDELPMQSVNGISLSGVTFTFEIDGLGSDDALFNSDSGPRDSVTSDAPFLNGNIEGILTLDFEVAIDYLRFSYVFSTLLTPDADVTVNLYDETLFLLEAITVEGRDEGFRILEGVFEYTGPAVARAEIDFNENSFARRFTIDTLMYNTMPTPMGVPEPGWFGLAGVVGLVVLGVRRLFSRR